MLVQLTPSKLFRGGKSAAKVGMEIFREIAPLRAFVSRRRRAGDPIGFVPTMGYLHAGHVSLVRAAAKRAACVVVSIFVNPTQFGPGEDLDTYPRDEAGDLEKCRAAGAAAVFLPRVAEMYPPDPVTTVRVTGMTAGLCGASRPGHFDGVTTIVTKLFAVVQPDIAVFGQKDYQQLAVIRRMVSELHLPIEVVGVPTAREDDGLALSSRNAYLSAPERADAPRLQRALRTARDEVLGGSTDVALLILHARDEIEASPHARIDYIEVVHPATLDPLTEIGPEGAVMALAVFMGKTRLIDNLRLDHRNPA
jgi:pantoate--beta-alanine ligase